MTEENNELDDLAAVRLITEALERFEQKDQERILRWAMEKMSLPRPTAQGPVPSTGLLDSSARHQPTSGSRQTDIRTFVSDKQPNSDNQFAATVAYYYAFEAPEEERKDSIDSNSLLEACRKVGRQRLRDPGKTLHNAHNMGYLDKAERGSYKINTVGENLVAVTLPSSSGNANSQRGARRRPRGRSSRDSFAGPVQP